MSAVSPPSGGVREDLEMSSQPTGGLPAAQPPAGFPPAPGYPQQYPHQYPYGYPYPYPELPITYERLVSVLRAEVSPIAADLRNLTAQVQTLSGDTPRRSDLESVRSELRAAIERMEGSTYPKAQLDIWLSESATDRKDLRAKYEALQTAVLGQGWTMFVKVAAIGGGLLTLLELSKFLPR
jgi:hypothetical protein